MKNFDEPEKMAVLSPSEAANRLGISPITLRKWSEKGLIRSLVTLGGHRRYPVQEVERLRLGQDKTRPSTLRILITDDDRFLSKFLEDFLLGLKTSIIVEIAKDGFEAGHKLAVFKPDIVLLDLMMPGIDGFEVCRRIKSETSTANIRVIAMTSYPSKENVERILEVGAEVCLTKPVETVELLKALNLH